MESYKSHKNIHFIIHPEFNMYTFACEYLQLDLLYL
jgi:hypothetical protein